LDEWTADQLEIMRISGNGNAKLFFRKHGVTESEMMVFLIFLDNFLEVWFYLFLTV
jgi:hypothetical protein